MGDNIDKHVKPREMRIDAQASTLHYFNVYALADRVDVSDLPDEPSLPDLSSINVMDVLPSRDDHRVLLSNIGVLIGRVIKRRMPFFATYAAGLEKHIEHPYSREMAHKSEVVRFTQPCLQ